MHRSTPAAGDGLWSPQRRTLTAGLILTVTLVAFEALAISTVMPRVAEELNGLESYGWVFTSFMLGSLIGIVVSGGLIDRSGLSRPYALGLGLFTVGLLLGGLAPSMEVLIGARVLQGLGAGAIPPIAYVAIGRTMPDRLRPRMFATLSTAWVLPGVFGPAIAGIVGEFIGWRVVFLGLLPLIALAAAISFPAIRRIGPVALSAVEEAAASASLRRRFPVALLVAVATGLFLVGLTASRPLLVAGLEVPTIVIAAIGVAIGLPALRSLTPPGTLVAARGVPAAILLRGVLTFTFFAVNAYIALALVTWRGQSLTEAGLTLTVGTVAWTAGSWIQARFASRWSPERFVRVGFVVVSIGLALFSAILSKDVWVWVALPTFAVCGIGMGLAYSPLSLIVLRDAAPQEQGHASASLSLTDTLGTALGTGITGALVAISVRADGQPVAGLAVGFAIAVVVGIVGATLALRLPAHPAVSPDASRVPSASST